MEEPTEMLKRVALAITDCDAAGPITWSEAIVVAKAVIEALRDPTPDMFSIGESYMDFILPEGFDNSIKGRQEEFATGWRVAMDVVVGQDPVTVSAKRIAERKAKRRPLPHFP